MLNFVKVFYASVELIIWYLSFILSVWWITLIFDWWNNLAFLWLIPVGHDVLSFLHTNGFDLQIFYEDICRYAHVEYWFMVFSPFFFLLFGFMSRYYWIHKMGWDIIPFTHIFLEGLHRIGIIPSHFSWHSLVNLLSLEYSLWKVFNYKTNFFSGYVASHVFYFFLYHFVK